MFLFMCTIFKENIVPVMENRLLLQNPYLSVPWSVAASSLKLVVFRTKNYTYVYFKTYDCTMATNVSHC